MVLLEHTLPDGRRHWDWLIERPRGGEGSRLISFRVELRIDGLHGEGRSFGAVRMADHRRQYLEYEGEVSGGRGRVVRVAHGEVLDVSERAWALVVTGWFGGGELGGERGGAADGGGNVVGGRLWRGVCLDEVCVPGGHEQAWRFEVE
jgi:hypothetical protein